MENNYFSDATIYLANVVLGSYGFIIMIRLVLQLVEADFYNPICKAIHSITNPVLKPVRAFLPHFKRIDSASLLMVIVFEIIAVWVTLKLKSSMSPSLLGLIVLSLGSTLGEFVRIFTWSIIIQAFLSWIAPDPRNPIVSVLQSITAPILSKARTVLPSTPGVDFSPIIALVALQLTLMLIVNPLHDAGKMLLF
ncbi:MAG: YggT family protein [Gammaproteobacteria bacterium]|jgi:YggT family protein